MQPRLPEALSKWGSKLISGIFAAYGALLAAAIGAFAGEIISRGSGALFWFMLIDHTLIILLFLLVIGWLLFGAIIDRIRPKRACIGIVLVFVLIFAPALFLRMHLLQQARSSQNLPLTRSQILQKNLHDQMPQQKQHHQAE